MTLKTQIELDWLKRWNMYSPESVALKDGDTGVDYTYKEFFENSCAGAQILSQEFEIQKGDRVAVLSTNEIEYVFLFFALQRLGATMVPINFRLTQREVEHIISDSDPSLIVYQEAYSSLVGPFKAKKLLLQGPNSFAEKLTQAPTSFTEFLSEEETPALILYTSGTTGSPKGAIISHRMIFWNSVNTMLRLDITQKDCAVIFLPFFHTGGWNVLTTPILHHGGKIVFLKKFEAEKILHLSEKEKATIIFGVPTTMDMMARTELFKTVNLKSVRYAIVGGEPMPIPLIRIWDEKGVPIRQGYGLTEFGPNVFSLNEKDAIPKIGSIGFPNFYIDAKIVDDHGNELPPHQVGELVLKGPMCMTGYWNNEKATQETIQKGWLHTGDLVRKDEAGYYYVVGRKKDMYISGGENVYPPELEQVLRTLPGIRDVAVIGVPDEKWGEVGKAFIVREQESLTQEDVINFCQKNLARFKIPKHIVFVPDLPKGDSGKILKRQLKEMYPN
ncbi:MAG: acid--CoA ligase [Oligoflexia bacterium]|nr:MAG: acid--CoA ligase [Oligoflexia bacterium]